MDASSLAKAVIINLERPGAPVKCMFNPKEYTLSKQNSWARTQAPGRNLPQIEFTSGEPASMQMQLFFDTYDTGADVRDKYTSHLWRLMMVDENLRDPRTFKARPPRVRFIWGKSWAFDAVMTSMRQQFTLFNNLGFPVRASVDVTFMQVKDSTSLRMQNPTSGGTGGERVWRVSAGDTLAWIAFKEYGDATKWRLIAAANRLTSLRRLQPGSVLVIPNE
jgi:nucleoid-associated protein YgaU